MTRSESLAHQCDYDERSSLIEVAQTGDLEMFSRLLAAKNPLDFGDGEGKRGLTRAVSKGGRIIMKLQAGNGAPIAMVF